MDIHKLEEHINEGKFEEAIYMIRLIGETKDSSCLEVLLKHLKETDNNKLRNVIALALSDIGNNKAVDALIEVLTDPKTKGSRGTLLYSLGELNYTLYIETIIGFIGDSSLEVRMEAFHLFEIVVDVLSEEQTKNCRIILESKWNDNRNEFVEDALELLN